MPDTTYEYLQGVFNGEHPIQRQNPQPGESEYYYIAPNQNPNKPFNELQTTDISSPQQNNKPPLQNIISEAFDSYPVANAIHGIYNKGKNIGEFIADAQIAYDHYNQMKKVGNQLVSGLGSGAGRDIDNYYHPLLQCRLAQISEKSKQNGLTLGEWKEVYDFYKKKYIEQKDEQEINNDSIKDLQNNVYGSTLGSNNKLKSCLELLDDRRTENMRKMGIR